MNLNRFPPVLWICVFLMAVAVDSAHSQWSDKVTGTPSLVQVDFGPYGEYLPGDGEEYCAPTSATMSIIWLARNGFTQLAPPNPTADQALNLDRILGGLMNTSVTGGTGGAGYYGGFSTYLRARGVGAHQFTHVGIDNPDAAWLQTNNLNQSVVNFSVGWFYPAKATNQFQNGGGHVLALLAADSTNHLVTLNNAYPASFFNVRNVPGENPQRVSITNVPTDWVIPPLTASQGYSQIITPILGPGKDTLAILWGADSWTLATNAMPGRPGYEPQTWTITGLESLDTNGGDLGVLAPLAGSGGIHKWGEGVLTLQATNSTTGTNIVSDGILASTVTSGTPFGTGAVEINGDAVLEAAPDDSQPAAVKLSIASGQGNSISGINGGGGLILRRGTNLSLTVTLGGNTDGTTTNLAMGGAATLLITPSDGLAGLGTSERLFINGSGGNLPPVSNGLVSPSIVGQNNDAIGSLGFLTYSVADGFEAAVTTSSTNLNINQAMETVIYEVDSPQEVSAGKTATVGALVVNGQTVGARPNATLKVGSGAVSSHAGVLLNSSSISTSVLEFGSANAFLGASGATNWISSLIHTDGSLTKFGAGNLTLVGSNQVTEFVHVAGGTLTVSHSMMTPTTVVRADATLELAGTNALVSGSIVLDDNNAILSLDGGTAAGGVNAGIESVIQGSGTIAGPAHIGGILRAGDGGGALVFTGPTTFSNATSFFWTLSGPNDNANPGTQPWNQFVFKDNLSLTGSIYLDFSTMPGPDSGDPFWRTNHSWRIFTFPQNYYWQYFEQNFSFNSGDFSIDWDRKNNLVNLVFTPETNSVPPSITIAFSPDGANVVLNYTGVLYGSDAITGPWASIAGATSPYSVPVNSANQKFYRAQPLTRSYVNAFAKSLRQTRNAPRRTWRH